MEKLWKKLSGFVLASVMAFSLSGKANAAEGEDTELPEPAPTAVVESAPAPSEPSAPVSAPSQSQSAPTQQTSPAAQTETPAAPAPAPAQTESAPAPAAPAQTESASAAPAPAQSEDIAAPAAPSSVQTEVPTVSAPAQNESSPAESAAAAPVEAAPAEEETRETVTAEPVSAAEVPAENAAAGESDEAVAAGIVGAAPTVTEPIEAAAEETEPVAVEIAEGSPAAVETDVPELEASGAQVSAGETDDAEGTEEDALPADPSEAETAETPPAAADAADSPDAPSETPDTADATAAPEESAADVAVPTVTLRSMSPSDLGLRTVTLRTMGAPLRSGSPGETADLVLVGDMGVQTVNAGADYTIKTAGYQHISTLTADADVYIIGTGILLVDNVKLSENGNVYLQPIKEIYGEDGGTVALFLLDGVDSEGNKIYTLINTAGEDGETAVPAILDEEYEIPSGVSLVVPENGSLVMQSVNAYQETRVDSGGNKVTRVAYSTVKKPDSPFDESEGMTLDSWDLVSTAPSLTISTGARLVIETGASFLLNHIDTTGAGQFFASPELNVQGALVLNDDVHGGIIVIGRTGDVTGNGYFVDSDEINIEGGRTTPITSFNADNAPIYIDTAGADINSMRTRGQVKMRYYGDLSVGSIHVSGYLRLSNHDIGEEDTITVGQTITGDSGAQFRLESGVLKLVGGAGAVTVPISDGEQILGYASTPTGGSLRWYAGALQSAPLLPLQGAVTSTASSISIPVANAVLVKVEHSYGFGHYSEYKDLERAVDAGNNNLSYTCDADGTITYAGLSSALGTTYTDDGGTKNYVYFVETCVGGNYGYALLKSGSTASVNAGDVVQICRMTEQRESEPEGGSASTNTNTTYTGSGVLGGSGAGSVSGGTRRLALSGSRTPAPDPEPVPEPVPVPDPDPDPEPVPQEETVVAAPAAEELRVWEEAAAEDSHFLHIELNGEPVTRLEKPVKVRMKFTPAADEADKPLFVVFRDENGALVAFEAYYDAASGELVFSSDMAGIFVVLSFEFDGELFSEEFYAALAALVSFPA